MRAIAQRARMIGSALVIAAVFTAPARADDPPPAPPAPSPANEKPGVPIPPADPVPVNGQEPGRDVKTPTVKEVAEVRVDKQLGNPWGFAAAFGGSVDRPAIATSFGGRYRITERWIVGLDAGWNPWITTSPMRMRTGVITVAGTVIRRFPMAFDRVNLRTSLHLGVSTLLHRQPQGTRLNGAEDRAHRLRDWRVARTRFAIGTSAIVVHG